MVVILGHIGTAFSAEQTNRAMDLGLVLFRSKTAVMVLQIPGRDRDISGQFDKIFRVSTGGTDQMAGGTAGRNLYFFLHGNNV